MVYNKIVHNVWMDIMYLDSLYEVVSSHPSSQLHQYFENTINVDCSCSCMPVVQDTIHAEPIYKRILPLNVNYLSTVCYTGKIN